MIDIQTGIASKHINITVPISLTLSLDQVLDFIYKSWYRVGFLKEFVDADLFEFLLPLVGDG